MDESRSELEVEIFGYVQLGFMLLRLVGLIYFIIITIKLMRNEKLKTDWESLDQQVQIQESNNSLDRSTILTFGFLIFEFLALMSLRTIQEVEKLRERSENFNFVKQILRCLGYMCANLALIYQTHKGKVVSQFYIIWGIFNQTNLTRISHKTVALNLIVQLFIVFINIFSQPFLFQKQGYGIVNLNRWFKIYANKQHDEKEYQKRDNKFQTIALITTISVVIDVGYCIGFAVYQILWFSYIVEASFFTIQSCIWNPTIFIAYHILTKKITNEQRTIENCEEEKVSEAEENKSYSLQ